MNATTTTPRAWIGCLAAYNNGCLHGEWVDAIDYDELCEGRERVLKTSPVPGAEEAFVADYDGFYGLASELGEYPSFERLARVGALIDEHGESFALMLATLELDLDDDATYDQWEEAFYSHHRGQWDSERDFAMELLAEVGWAGIEGHVLAESEIWSYLDWDIIVRDLFRHGNYTSATDSSYQLHVFEEEV